jgi:hypothetical protein
MLSIRLPQVGILYHDDIDAAFTEADSWGSRLQWTPEHGCGRALLGSACRSTKKPFLVFRLPLPVHFSYQVEFLRLL